MRALVGLLHVGFTTFCAATLFGWVGGALFLMSWLSLAQMAETIDEVRR